jgi:hypothetical protein
MAGGLMLVWLLTSLLFIKLFQFLKLFLELNLNFLKLCILWFALLHRLLIAVEHLFLLDKTVDLFLSFSEALDAHFNLLLL